MYTVEVKTSRPWSVRRNLLEANKWTVVANASDRRAAEESLSWILLDFEDATEVLSNTNVSLRIREAGNTVYEQEKSY